MIYPALPYGSVDHWHLIEPRAAWLTVLLIAAMGFGNYVLLKIYGARGLMFTGFFGGLINSSVTVAELAARSRASAGGLSDIAYRGVVVATAAMVLRNAVVLLLLMPRALLHAAIPFVLMAAGVGALLVGRKKSIHPHDVPTLPLSSPFSIGSAIKFGILFLVLQICGTLAQRALGRFGFYAVSFCGGLVSSAERGGLRRHPRVARQPRAGSGPASARCSRRSPVRSSTCRSSRAWLPTLRSRGA